MKEGRKEGRTIQSEDAKDTKEGRTEGRNMKEDEGK